MMRAWPLAGRMDPEMSDDGETGRRRAPGQVCSLKWLKVARVTGKALWGHVRGSLYFRGAYLF